MFAMVLFIRVLAKMETSHLPIYRGRGREIKSVICGNHLAARLLRRACDNMETFYNKVENDSDTKSCVS